MKVRIIKAISALFVAAALGGAFYYFRLWERDWSAIDEGWASLIGSAMGSFLAVLGALYVSKAEDRRKKKEFEDFVKVCVQNLVVQASYLEAMAREPHKIAPTPEVQAGIISIQLRNLTDALAVFDREIANSKDGDYHFRREIIALDSMLTEATHALRSEAPTPHIITHWHTGAYQVRQFATIFLDGFRWVSPIPPSHLIAETVSNTIKAWKSWNIPVQTTIAPHSVSADTSSQSLHHATA